MLLDSWHVAIFSDCLSLCVVHIYDMCIWKILIMDLLCLSVQNVSLHSPTNNTETKKNFFLLTHATPGILIFCYVLMYCPLCTSVWYCQIIIFVNFLHVSVYVGYCYATAHDDS